MCIRDSDRRTDKSVWIITRHQNLDGNKLKPSISKHKISCDNYVYDFDLRSAVYFGLDILSKKKRRLWDEMLNVEKDIKALSEKYEREIFRLNYPKQVK